MHFSQIQKDGFKVLNEGRASSLLYSKRFFSMVGTRDWFREGFFRKVGKERVEDRGTLGSFAERVFPWGDDRRESSGCRVMFRAVCADECRR